MCVCLFVCEQRGVTVKWVWQLPWFPGLAPAALVSVLISTDCCHRQVFVCVCVSDCVCEVTFSHVGILVMYIRIQSGSNQMGSHNYICVFISNHNCHVCVCVCVCVPLWEIKVESEAAVFVSWSFGLIRKQYHVSSMRGDWNWRCAAGCSSGSLWEVCVLWRVTKILLSTSRLSVKDMHTFSLCCKDL